VPHSSFDDARPPPTRIQEIEIIVMLIVRLSRDCHPKGRHWSICDPTRMPGGDRGICSLRSDDLPIHGFVADDWARSIDELG
jgi:hypothetical protein